MRRVPRATFVDEGFEEFAYEDSPLPIGSGQTISQPFIVARMAEVAEIAPPDRVLEIGTGSGYAAAMLGEIASEVFTMEAPRRLGRARREAPPPVRLGRGSERCPRRSDASSGG